MKEVILPQGTIRDQDVGTGPVVLFCSWPAREPSVVAKGCRTPAYDSPLHRGRRSTRFARCPDDILADYIRPAATSSGVRRDVAKFASSVSNEVTLQVAKDLRSFTKPTLLLWPPNDEHLPISLAERLCEDIPNARLVRVEDSHIFVPEDRPEVCAAEIAAFAQ